MPKKTKKQKMLAHVHRINPYTYSIPKISPIQDSHAPHTIDGFADIKRDIIKTILIVVVIIASELAVSRFLS